MFHLTPQERLALAWVLTVFLVGTLINIGLNRDARLVQWVDHPRPAYSPFPLDINKADAGQLDKVPGIGPVTARRIVDHREKNGPFSDLIQLTKVKGISKARVGQMQRYLR